MHVGIDDGWTGISMMGGQMVCGHFFIIYSAYYATQHNKSFKRSKAFLTSSFDFSFLLLFLF